MSLLRGRFGQTTRPQRRRVGGGWLSLFAMWMIFVGPLVSQSMPMDHHAGMNMPMAEVHHHAGKGHDAPGDDGQLHALWEKCGYCSLLFNCPALPETLSPLTIGATAPAAISPSLPLSGHARQAVFPGARSRAPPLAIHV